VILIAETGLQHFGRGAEIMRGQYLAVVFGLFLAGVGNAGAAEDCGLKPYASIPTENTADGRVLLDVAINGQPVKLRLELARLQSYVTEKLVKKLGLTETGGGGGDGTIREEDGVSLRHFVPVRKVNLGQLLRTELSAAVLENVDDIDGTIGNMWFEGYDIEIDPARHRVNLFLQDHCPGTAVYWTDSYFQIDSYFDPRSTPIYTNVVLDGKPIRATLDTGKSRTTLAAATAQSVFEVTADKDGVRPAPVPSMTGSTVQSFDHTFGALEIGPLRLPNKKVAIADLARYQQKFTGSQIAVTDDRPELRRLMLGMDVLSRLHLFIAYKEQKIYFTLADERGPAAGAQNAPAAQAPVK
jgi:hypothetical protein